MEILVLQGTVSIKFRKYDMAQNPSKEIDDIVLAAVVK